MAAQDANKFGKVDIKEETTLSFDRLIESYGLRTFCTHSLIRAVGKSDICIR